MQTKIPEEWTKFILKDVTFVNIMRRHVYHVLIVANPYDAFMLEDDGRIEEKVFNEYMELGLRYPPMFTQVSTIEEAEKVLAAVSVDLVICMPAMPTTMPSPWHVPSRRVSLTSTVWCLRRSPTASPAGW